jgi:hypothetical protein
VKKILLYGRQVSGIKSSVAVSRRNVDILADELNADRLQYDSDKLKHTEYDVIICTYSNRYTDFVTLKSLIRKNQTRFILRTEYEKMGSLITEYKPFNEICNFEGGQNFINTNLLIAKPPNAVTPKKYDCIYYSRYRADRMIYCKKYLNNDIYFSTHPKNHKHFFHAGCKPKLLKHIDWTHGKETLNLFRYSLYMEDVYTHSVFNNLANRWYEAGFCNNVVFFDVNCWNTILKSEIGIYKDQIENYIVSDYDELKAKIQWCNENFEYHLSIQKAWRINEMNNRNEMINQLKNIINNS